MIQAPVLETFEKVITRLDATIFEATIKDVHVLKATMYIRGSKVSQIMIFISIVQLLPNFGVYRILMFDANVLLAKDSSLLRSKNHINIKV